MDQNCTPVDGKDSILNKYEMLKKESVKCNLIRTKWIRSGHLRNRSLLRDFTS